MHIQYCLNLQAARLNFVTTKNKRNNSTLNCGFSGMFKYPEKKKTVFKKGLGQLPLENSAEICFCLQNSSSLSNFSAYSPQR